MSYQVEFILTGEMPLLMHADNVEAADTLMEWRKDTSNKDVTVRGDDRSPAWTWQTYLYHDGVNVSLQSSNLATCLRQAGAQIILKKQKTFKELSQSGMMATTEFLTFTINGKQIPMATIAKLRDLSFAKQAAAVQELGFRLDVRRASVGQSKHIRVRPRFDVWECCGTMDVLRPTELTFDIVSQLFDLAGRVGLCDWRPGCKTPGPFGMFTSKLKKR